MSECTHCSQIMGSSKAPHEHLVKLREHHTHPVYRCSKCDSELVLLFDCWEPCFQGWLPAATG